MTADYMPWWGFLVAFLAGALMHSIGEVFSAWAKRIREKP